MSKIKKIVGH